jgi:hypothetical protein
VQSIIKTGIEFNSKFGTPQKLNLPKLNEAANFFPAKTAQDFECLDEKLLCERVTS